MEAVVSYIQNEIDLPGLRTQIYIIYFEAFYLMTLAMTVVGYGDSESMPDL